MARNYKRDAKGRFAKVKSSRRSKKIKKLQEKNRRVRETMSQDNRIQGSPLERRLEQRIYRRTVKIKKLSAKNSASRAR